MGVITATWEEITFGDPHVGRRRAMQWIPNSVPSNSLKPCLIYCAGRGWHGRHPANFYDPVIGEPLFNDHISPAETTNPIACFSMFQASKTQNFYSTVGTAVGGQADAWNNSTTYVLDDKVNNTFVYDVGPPALSRTASWQCIKGHDSSVDPDQEPGAGVSGADVWYEIPKADIGHQYWDGYAETASYRGSGIRDLQVLIQYIVKNASYLGIDPAKICVMGSSAGGQQAGATAYADPAPFVAELNQVLSNPDASSAGVSPAACVLHITPDSFNNYNNYSALANNLFNTVTSQADWDTTSADEKAALSPLDTLNATGNSIPTFLAYGGNGTYRGQEDDPPYGDTDAGGFHKARNGWQMNLALRALGQTGVTYVDDSPDTPAPLGEPVAKSQFGMNLSPNKDYNPQFPFANIMKSSREWFSAQSGTSSDFSYSNGGDLFRPILNNEKYPILTSSNGSGVPLDAGETEAAVTLLFWDLEGKWKDGAYIIKHDGEGTLIFGHSAEEQYGVTSWSFTDGAYRVNTDNTIGQGIYLKINTSNPINPVSNISVVHLDDVNLVVGSETYQREKYTFTPDYIAAVENCKVLRFMDWGETNTSNIVSWATDRPTRDWCTWTLGGYGVPVEVMTELCNTVQADMWYCIPHQADSEFAGDLAMNTLGLGSDPYTRALDANLTLYLEYTNEPWNSAGGFEQNAWLQDQVDPAAGGTAQGGGTPYNDQVRFYSSTAAVHFASFEVNWSLFSFSVPIPTLKRVYGTANHNTFTTNYGLGYEYPPGSGTFIHESIDVVATAPYLGQSLGGTNWSGLPYTDITTALAAEVITEFTDDGSENVMKQWNAAATFNKQLVCYEAGQHIVDTLSSDTSRAKILEANRSVEMNAVYDSYLAAWAAMEVLAEDPTGPMVLFEHCQKYHESDGSDRDSSFGMLEYLPWVGDPTPIVSQKWLAFTGTIGGSPGDPPGATTYNVYEDTVDHNTPTRTILSTEEPLNIFNWLKTTLSF
jgi:hypothetical protein